MIVNIYLRSINDIDDYKMEFSVQVTFREQWNDERLKFDDFDGKLILPIFLIIWPTLAKCYFYGENHHLTSREKLQILQKYRAEQLLTRPEITKKKSRGQLSKPTRIWQSCMLQQCNYIKDTIKFYKLDHKPLFRTLFPGNFRYLTLTDPGKVWMPDTFFRNEKQGHFHSILVNNVYVRVFPNGDVLYSIRLVSNQDRYLNLGQVINFFCYLI